MNKSMRLTFIMLVPKKKGAREIGGYWPICLINSLYKIISKVLFLRLRRVIGMVVSSS